MRLTPMNRPFARRSFLIVPALVAALLLSGTSLMAQNAVPAGTGDSFKDTTPLKLPAGQRAAIYEFEDLECPACAHAFPIVHTAVDRYKIALIRHDYPLFEIHVWSTIAAITARYLQDKVSPGDAEQYRRDVFQNQTAISSKDDLANFTKRWFDAHHQQMPFVTDPSGRFAAEVQADRTLGDRIGLKKTPTIFVLAPKGWTQVTDITQLYTVIDAALLQTPDKPAVKAAVKARATKAAPTAKTAVHKTAPSAK